MKTKEQALTNEFESFFNGEISDRQQLFIFTKSNTTEGQEVTSNIKRGRGDTQIFIQMSPDFEVQL